MDNNSDDKDNLIGFRDFIDTDEAAKLKKSKSSRLANDFELITFLEQDSQRLSNHIETFEEKAYVIKNYSQDPSLNIEAEHRNIQSRVDTISLCLRQEAPVYRNIAEIFSNFFKF
jgi:hypothetical protein